MKVHLFLLLLFIHSLPLLKAQQADSSMRINETEWKRLTEEVDYTETYKDKKQEDAKKKKAQSTKSSSKFNFDLSNYRYIIYFLVLALIAFLSYRVLRNYSGNSEIKKSVIGIDEITKIEEKIHEVNLDELLLSALNLKNYQIALRLNFLIIIKLLSQSGKINWAKEKTNWEYYSELKDKLLADQFKTLIINFETFWYGEHPVSEFEYHQIAPLYQSLQKKLKPNG